MREVKKSTLKKMTILFSSVCQRIGNFFFFVREMLNSRLNYQLFWIKLNIDALLPRLQPRATGAVV